jgi:hypothetical protein
LSLYSSKRASQRWRINISKSRTERTRAMAYLSALVVHPPERWVSGDEDPELATANPINAYATEEEEKTKQPD